jgi:hypothetical protein
MSVQLFVVFITGFSVEKQIGGKSPPSGSTLEDDRHTSVLRQAQGL